MELPEKTASRAIVYTYLGINESGNLRLRSETEELHVTGVLYTVSNPGKVLPGKPKKVAWFELEASPGFTRNPKLDSNFSVKTSSGVRLRVVGHVASRTKLLVTKNRRVILRTPIASPTTPEDTPNKALTQPTIKRTRSKKPNEDEQFARELERVTTLSAKGIDPDIHMSFLHKVVGKSRSQMHKDIALGKFPKPIKQGHSATWKYSTLQKYQDAKSGEH